MSIIPLSAPAARSNRTRWLEQKIEWHQEAYGRWKGKVRNHTIFLIPTETTPRTPPGWLPRRLRRAIRLLPQPPARPGCAVHVHLGTYSNGKQPSLAYIARNAAQGIEKAVDAIMQYERELNTRQRNTQQAEADIEQTVSGRQ